MNNSYFFRPAPKFPAMEAVAISTDTLNFGLPVGHKAFVIADNTGGGTALTHLVRVPDMATNYWVPECDLVRWDDYVTASIDQAIQGYRINDALDRRDIDAFNAVTTKEDERIT